MANDLNDSSTNSVHSTDTARAKRTINLSFRSLELAVIVIVLCIISFIGGAQWQKHHHESNTAPVPTSNSSMNNQRSSGEGFAKRGGLGTVTAVSSTSITITNQRTSTSTTYSISTSTTITDNDQTVTVSDIQTGDRVLIRTSGAGSTAATSIMVNPSFGEGSGGQPGNSTMTQPPTSQ